MSGLQDRRRNLGPTDFQPFSVDSGTSTQSVPEAVQDGLRKVFVSQGVARNASGSAYIEVGSIRIQCTVHGPQPLRGDFQERGQVSVTTRIEPFAGITQADEKEQMLSEFVSASLAPAIVLENYPKSAILIHLSVLSGPDTMPTQLAAGVNAATLALINAGIAMHDMVTASTVSLLDGRVVADVDSPAEVTQLCASFLTGSGAKARIAGFDLTGSSHVPRDQLEAMFQRAETAAQELRALFNGYLIEDYASAS